LQSLLVPPFTWIATHITRAILRRVCVDANRCFVKWSPFSKYLLNPFLLFQFLEPTKSSITHDTPLFVIF